MCLAFCQSIGKMMKLDIIVGGMMALGLSACGDSSDSQIGIDYRQSEIGHPIRQKEILEPGDPLISVGDECVGITNVSMYMRYSDINNNGQFDAGTDIIIYRVPRSDPVIFQYLDPEMSQQLVLR